MTRILLADAVHASAQLLVAELRDVALHEAVVVARPARLASVALRRRDAAVLGVREVADLVRERMARAPHVRIRLVERVQIVERDTGILRVDDGAELALVAAERLVLLTGRERRQAARRRRRHRGRRLRGRCRCRFLRRRGARRPAHVGRAVADPCADQQRAEGQQRDSGAAHPGNLAAGWRIGHAAKWHTRRVPLGPFSCPRARSSPAPSASAGRIAALRRSSPPACGGTRSASGTRPARRRAVRGRSPIRAGRRRRG